MSDLTPWQQYKQNLGNTRPWDMLNPKVEHVSEELVSVRMNLCLSCEHITKLTNQCKKCGCFMSAKTKLLNASCPVGKW